MKGAVFKQFQNHGLTQKLDDRGLQAVDSGGPVLHLDIGEAARAVAADIRGVIVDRLARKIASRGHGQRDHARPWRSCGVPEYLEVHVSHCFGDVVNAQGIAQVRLVRTILSHRLGVGEHRKLPEFDINGLAKDLAQHDFGKFHHGRLVNKRRLYIDLGEFRLPVGAQILIAKALHDLVVAIHSAHDEELLEHLRRLRQCIEITLPHTARHKVVSRTLRCRARQHGRFDFNKSHGFE